MVDQNPSNVFSLAFDGTALPARVLSTLVRLCVDAQLHTPDLFVATFRDPDHSFLDDNRIRIGAAVTVSVTNPGNPTGQVLLDGEVTAVELDVDPTGTLTIVRGYDQSHRLFRGRTTASYADVTYGDVATQVAQRAKLQVGTIDATTAVHPLVSQWNCSDWQFLSGLAQEIGYELTVEHGALSFRKPVEASTAPPPGSAAGTTTGPLQLRLAADIIRLRAVVTAAEQVSQVQVRAWDPKQKAALVASAPSTTSGAQISLSPNDIASTFAAPDQVASDRPYGTQTDVDSAAGALAERVAGCFAELEGVARGNAQLRPGRAISLSLAGAPFDGKYTVTAAQHRYDPADGYTTGFTVSGRQARTLLALTDSGGGGGGRIPGVVAALVSDVDDPEHLGRVRLTFPWLSDTYVSDWTRMAQAGAGGSRGTVMLPEVNDEVLVAFEHGDLRRPYVLSGLYNGVDKPDLGDGLIDPGSGAVTRRGIVSKNRHSLVFFDGDAKSGAALLTGDRHLRLSLNESTTTVTVTSSGSVKIDGSQEVTVTSGGKLTLKASGELALSGAKVTVSANGPVELAGQPIKLN